MNIIEPSMTKQLVKPEPVGIKLSTHQIAPHERVDWLREVICREYTQLEITSAVDGDLSQDFIFYPWEEFQLSIIKSSPLSLRRLPTEPHLASQNAYFAVLLLSGNYRLEQNGREVLLQPGDMTIYDATRPHQIHCYREASNLIYLAIPRAKLRNRVADIDRCTALRIPGTNGIGFVAANFMHTFATQADQLQTHEFSSLFDQTLDLLALAVTSVRPVNVNLSRSRAASINTIKTFIEQNLQNTGLDTYYIAQHAGLSARYINKLFEEEGTSLIRYVWKRRLENCSKDIKNPVYTNQRMSDIAFRWGFNDAAHFSRAFKKQFGSSPSEYKSKQ